MSDYQAAAPLDQITPGQVHAVAFAGHMIGLTLLADGSPRAFQSLCPHDKANLAGGRVEGCTLHCPRHFARFDLDDGAVSAGWRIDDLKLYPARISAGQVEADAAAVRANPPEGRKTVWIMG